MLRQRQLQSDRPPCGPSSRQNFVARGLAGRKQLLAILMFGEQRTDVIKADLPDMRCETEPEHLPQIIDGLARLCLPDAEQAGAPDHGGIRTRGQSVALAGG